VRPLVLGLFAMLAIDGTATAADRMTFWNLTSSTLAGLSLAPAGSAAFGPNQCANDRDGTVDHDERLRLTGIDPGRYDVRTTDKKGRVCMARNVAVSGKGRYAFSLSDEDLTECSLPP
jgi:hypothetical protein